MNILVLGGTGATGQLLVSELLERGDHVRVVVRSASRLPERVRNHPNLQMTEGSFLDIDDGELESWLADTHAVASCLGHNLTFKGIYGHPRLLVTDAAKKVTNAILKIQPRHQVKYILMNTTGNRNLDIDEKIPVSQSIAVGLIRKLLPPYVDNEHAVNHLRTQIGQDNPFLSWAAVRPDTLIDADKLTPYDTHPSPTRNPIFDAGKSSRINVAHFMAELINNASTWASWKGKMPVLYNRS